MLTRRRVATDLPSLCEHRADPTAAKLAHKRSFLRPTWSPPPTAGDAGYRATACTVVVAGAAAPSPSRETCSRSHHHHTHLTCDTSNRNATGRRELAGQVRKHAHKTCCAGYDATDVMHCHKLRDAASDHALSYQKGTRGLVARHRRPLSTRLAHGRFGQSLVTVAHSR
jgi:hypothetical protein